MSLAHKSASSLFRALSPAQTPLARFGLGSSPRLAVAAAALVSLAGASVAMAQYYPGMYMGGQPYNRNQSRYPADYDWSSVDDSDGEGGGDRYAPRAARGGDEAPLIFKTDLGREIQKIQFRRDPASVLAARTKLAQDWRKFITLEGPPAPEPDASPTGPSGMPGIPGMEGMDGSMSDGDGEGGMPANFDPAAMMRQMQAMAGAAAAAAMPATPDDPAAEETPATGDSPATPAGDAASGAAPASAADGAAASPTTGPATGPSPGGAPGKPSNAASSKLSEAAKAKAAKAAALKLAKRRAAEFGTLVTAGDWSAVGRFIRDFGGVDSDAMYTLVLQQLSAGDQAAVPGDVVALSEIAPPDATGTCKLSERQIKLLGALLKNTAGRGGDPSGVATSVREGTTFFGGPDGGEGAEVQARAQKRKNAATLMMSAGLTVLAQPYLAPLEKAKADRDPELLNLYITYFDALSKKKEGAEKVAVQLQGWDVAMEVLKLDNASIAQRALALSGALKLLDVVDKPVGDAFMRELFMSPTSDRVDLAWATIQKCKSKSAKLRQMSAPPEVRTKQLAIIQRLGQAVLAANPNSGAAAWQAGLNMLTQAILDEAEVSRSQANRGGGNPYNPYNPYGGDDDYDGSGRNRLQPIPTEDLNRLLPDDKWLLAIDPGLAAKLELLVAGTQGAAGDVSSVLELIRPIATKDPARALKLAEVLLKSWPAYTKHSPNEAANYTSRNYRYNRYYGGFYGGMYGGEGGGGIPLTRAMQARHLAKLRDLIAELELMKVGPLPAQALVDAFASSHSSAEVFVAEDINAVFGPIDNLSQEMRLKLADGMRRRLAGMWRNQQVQQQAGTKRTEQEVGKEVVRGYDLALQVAPSDDGSAQGWQGTLAKADLTYDKAEYLFGRKVDVSVYTEMREKAFELYKEASGRYQSQLVAGKVQPNARAFTQWFNSSLGASDLGFLTRQDAPDAGQLDQIKGSLASLPADTRRQHIELFAQSCTTALAELNPELKHKFARQAVQLLGDVPQAREIKTILSYYDDLTKEVQLNLAVDGSSDVGREPFGAVLSVWSSVSVSRESGGFGRYINPQDWNPQTGEPLDRREGLEKKLREALADRFEVASVTFSKPDVKPMPIAEGGREGWEQTVLAYLVLKAKDKAADKLPPVSIDMDFRDTTGTVMLPVSSGPTLIDARAERGPNRTVQNPTIEMLLDDRTFAKGSPTGKELKDAMQPGELTIEVRAKGEGLLPGLDKLLDLASVKGFEVVKVEDRGISITELQQRLGRVIPVSERTWTVRLAQSGGAVAAPMFNFPAPIGPFAAAKIETKRYADADVVTTKGPIELAAVEGRATKRALILGGTVAAVALVGLGVWLLVRRAVANRPKPAGPRFSMPPVVTPVTTLAVLRQIQSLNGAVLSTSEQEALLVEIKSIEQRAFAPDAKGVQPADLSRTLSEWIAKAG